MTKLIYMHNPKLLQVNTKIKNIVQHDLLGLCLELEETPFYVKGGGQLADRGHVKSDSFQADILNVVRTPEGQILHICEVTSGRPAVNISIECFVDIKSRTLNSKLHSAGHLIDQVVKCYKNGLLKPIKGCHYPGSCFLEYEVQNLNLDDLSCYIDSMLPHYIQADYRYINNFDEKTNIKMLQIGSFDPVACGGTHVRSSSELKGLQVTKLKMKKGNLRISYNIL